MGVHRNNRIALLEFGTSHVECMYSQLAFLNQGGYDVHLIARDGNQGRYQYVQSDVHCHWLPNQATNRGFLATSRSIARYIRRHNITTVIINTYSGTLLKWLLPQLSGVGIFGVVHDLKMFEKSLFRKYLALNARHFWVLNDHLLQFAPRRFGLQFESFYPVFYPDFPPVHIEKPAGDFWVGIPGQVELKRKNFDLLFRENLAALSASIKFILLGPSLHSHGSGHMISEAAGDCGKERFIMFDDFVDDRVFHSYLARCDMLMPLVAGKARYQRAAISGTYNLSFGYNIPMLIEESSRNIGDLAEYALHFQAGKLIDVLNHLTQNPAILETAKAKIENAVKFSFDYQSGRYLRRISTRHPARHGNSAFVAPANNFRQSPSEIL